MSKFAFMVFEDEKKAYEGLHALQELHAEGSVTVYGTDVLARDADGRLSILKSNDEGPLGTGLGALMGGLVGLLGGPVGAAIGATVGGTAGAVGDVVNLGVSEEFLRSVEGDLAPGKFAVLAEISEEWTVPLDARLEELGAKVVREDRVVFAEDLLEKRVNARKAKLAQLEAEHAKRKAERAMERAGTKAEEMMRELLDEELEGERQKLEKIAEKGEQRLERARSEVDAKVEALLEQASEAKPDVRARIEGRIAELRAEFAGREATLLRARQLTREALQRP